MQELDPFNPESFQEHDLLAAAPVAISELREEGLAPSQTNSNLAKLCQARQRLPMKIKQRTKAWYAFEMLCGSLKRRCRSASAVLSAKYPAC